MGDGTLTDVEQMAAFQTRASAVATSLTDMLTSLMNRLTPLEAFWIGKGGSAFASTKAIVDDETKRLNNALNGIAADVGTAGAVYANSDAEQGSTMSQVGSQVTGISAGLQPA